MTPADIPGLTVQGSAVDWLLITLRLERVGKVDLAGAWVSVSDGSGSHEPVGGCRSSR